MPDYSELSNSPSDFELIETMLYSHRVCYLEAHLTRARRSAALLQVRFDEQLIRNTIADHIAGLQRNTRYKVRMTINQAGHPTVTCSPISREKINTRRLCISSHRIDADNVFFHHKTTNRSLYEREYDRAQEAGYSEVLFFNQGGLLTEASRHNIFVQIKKRVFTPPLRNGLLPGIYRGLLLDRCQYIQEKEMTREDLEKASAIYLSNAVQGLKKFRLNQPLNFLPLENT